MATHGCVHQARVLGTGAFRCFPALLLDLSGHVLAVCGAVFADRFFFVRLVLIYIGPRPISSLPSSIVGRSDIEVCIRKATKLLQTLERCIQEINYRCSSLGLRSTRSSLGTSTTHSKLPFPLFHALRVEV